MRNLMLTLGAFILLSTILVGFYGNLAWGEDTVNNAASGISQLTYATTYMELIHGLAFDEMTVDSFITSGQIGLLTSPGALGADNPPPVGELLELNFQSFDDIDDLNNLVIVDSSLAGVTGIYRTTFSVHYVDPDDIAVIKSSRTFVKRIDMQVARLRPPGAAPLTFSTTVGYFHFD